MPSPTNVSPVRNSKRKKCVIEDVWENAVDKLVVSPILVSFRTPKPQEGEPEAHLEKEEFSEGNRVGHKYMSRLTITGYGDKKYLGQNLRNKNSVQDETVLLGVLNKSTGKMKLVEMEHFMVAPDLGNIKTTAMHTTLDPTQRLDAVTAFGTKRAIKAHKANLLERARQTSDVVESMQCATENIAESSRILDTEADSSSDYSYVLPPINENAAVAGDIYNMSSVVPDAVLETLVDEARDLLDATIPKSDKLSTLFVTSLAVAKLDLDEETRLRHACACIYMEHLTRIISRQTLALDNMDAVLVAHFRKHFMEKKKTKARISDTSRDKALGQLLVLALLVNQCRVKFSAITNSVTVPKPKLVKFLSALRMKQTASDIRLILPLPPAPANEFRKIELTKRKNR